ncbi:MAG: NAD(P)H-dependent oxidoreductase [bacterium]
MNSIEALNWRYATKHFDASKKLSNEQFELVKESLRLAPSSFGVQPWKFFIISNTELREKLRAAGYGQPQITDASQLVVFTVPTNLDSAYVDQFIKHVAEVKGISEDVLKGYGDMIKGKVSGMTPAAVTEWAARQAYIALGTLLTSLAHESIDAAPMEGFDPAQFDTILGLSEQHLTTVVIAGVGFRSADDTAAAMPKMRFAQSDVIVELE